MVDLMLSYSVFSCSVYLLTSSTLGDISDLEAEFSSLHNELAYIGMKIMALTSLTLDDLTNFANWPRLRNLFTLILFVPW